MNFKKILIANRGEIAVRVIRACKELGIEAITLYTSGEEKLPHVIESDRSVYLGEGSLSDTYLDGKKIIEIAKEEGADAIHPGYGFLSERANFAREVTKAGLKFIGPAPATIELMGDKVASKVKMEEIGIPLIPGYHGEKQDADVLLAEAKKIGFPVLVKASAGGGGKGMRIVNQEDEFLDSLMAAKREAKSAFGDDRVLIEKFIQNPRHIEVQVLSDQHGHHFHFFERECSIQRRYQKIVEESPSAALTPEIRNEMCQCAVKICESIKYEGVGTVEFIYDEDSSFYFLEMNTRLQVEHPVTELVTGRDLVKLQIDVAEGKELNFSQENLIQNGHAIEVRIYAENPDNGFLPSIGEIKLFCNNTLGAARVDTGYKKGNKVTVDYDPMIAKVIVHGEDREHARMKMKYVLENFVVGGVTTNIEYLLRILKHPEFCSGNTFTHFVETYKDELLPTEQSPEDIALAISTKNIIGTAKNESGATKEVSEGNAWTSLSGYRIGAQ